MDYLKRTDNVDEMIAIGRRIAEDKKDLYTPMMMKKMMAGVESHIPDASDEEKEKMVYRAIYDWWAFGANVDEEFYLHFNEMTSVEKDEYLVDSLRLRYIDHLNSGGGKAIKQLLQDKYKLYMRLKPYFKRDMIEIGEDAAHDFDVFEQFVGKHHEFVVKPSDYYGGIGVHKASMDEYGNDARLAYDSIINEGIDIKKNHPSRDHRIVLEELIIQDESMAMLHRGSVNAIRATAVRDKEGKIHVFHPWIKVGMNGTFVASAVLNGFDAEIDAKTGVVISDGYQESGRVFEFQPDTGVRMKGFQIPRWDEMLVMVDELMELMPEYGYIGWDLVLTENGWVVMEGNYNGDFMFQLINGRGYRREFEELIGWKLDKDFWWQAL
jgi:hypothetical protein